MEWKSKDERRYKKKVRKFLASSYVCEENRNLYKEFFEKEEYKLKRQNGLSELDDRNYKTLYEYVIKFSNVNKWFKNKPLKDITKEDFKKVYDDLEDGEIKNKQGKPFKDLTSYYNKVFRSKLFNMAGKRDIVQDVMEFTTKKKSEEVRFIEEQIVRDIIDVIGRIDGKLLVWLAFDIGENINSLLELKRLDFTKITDPETGQEEYRVNLRREILKRSRTPRSEITNYEETTKLLDKQLNNLQPQDKLFTFGYSNAVQILERAVRITQALCLPKGLPVTWKDLRSSMACDLLKKGWTTDEVNKRLGHKPSSEEIDKYVNFLALDGHKSKSKVQQHSINKLHSELEESRMRERLQVQRMEEMQQKLEQMQEQQLKLFNTMDKIDVLASKELIIKVYEQMKQEKNQNSEKTP